MEGAHGVLLSISGGSDLGLFEINEAASLVSDAAHPDANIIFGAVIDDALGDEVRVTVIAAGFDQGKPGQRKDAGMASLSSSAPAAPAVSAAPAAPSAPTSGTLRPPAVPAQTGERLVTQAPAAAAPSSPAAPRPGQPGAAQQGGGITVPPLPPIAGPGNNRRPLASEDFEEELDIPEFLRSQ
jgi:cell division protein FtsZ